MGSLTLWIWDIECEKSIVLQWSRYLQFSAETTGGSCNLLIEAVRIVPSEMIKRIGNPPNYVTFRVVRVMEGVEHVVKLVCALLCEYCVREGNTAQLGE